METHRTNADHAYHQCYSYDDDQEGQSRKNRHFQGMPAQPEISMEKPLYRYRFWSPLFCGVEFIGKLAL